MENRKELKLTDEDKQLVLEYYTDIEWCDDVTHMRCTRCQNVAIINYVFNCGHLICNSCYVNRRPKECEGCGEIITKLSLWDVETESRLCQLKVCCPNKKYGCLQVDQLGYIVDHMRCCLITKDTSLATEQAVKTTMDALHRHMSDVSAQFSQMSDDMTVMKNVNEANWKKMETKMTELQQKMDNSIDQLTKELHAQTQRITSCEMLHKGGNVEDILSKQMELTVDNTMEQLHGITSDSQVQGEEPTSIRNEKDPRRKTIRKLKQLRDEVEKVKSEQTRLAAKAKEDMEAIHTVKGRADTFIQLLEQKDRKMKKKLNKQESKINGIMDVHKVQLETMKTKIASMGTDQNQTDQTVSKNCEGQLELVKLMEEMKAQMQREGDGLRLKIDNQVTTTNNRLAAIDSRVTANSQKLTETVSNMTTIRNEMAATAEKVNATEFRITATDKKVDATDRRITTTDNKVNACNDRVTATVKKVDATDRRITATVKKVDTCNNRITTINNDVTTRRIPSADRKVASNDNLITITTDNKVTTTKLSSMEIWLYNSIGAKPLSEYNETIEAAQKQLKNSREFGPLFEEDGCRIFKFHWNVMNIEEEIAKANIDSGYHFKCMPFYTSLPGYKVRLLVYPNYGNRKHVGVYLRVVEGEFDDIVSWPFQCKYEFHSVSRNGKRFASASFDPSTATNCEDSFTRPPNVQACGTNVYIKSETLLANKSQYLIDGGLKIEVAIRLSD